VPRGGRETTNEYSTAFKEEHSFVALSLREAAVGGCPTLSPMDLHGSPC
jgi:hypothetical protein